MIKNTTTYFFLTLFLGWLGVHRFYRKQWGIGILYLFTAGIFGIGWIIDLIISIKILYDANKRSKVTQAEIFYSQPILTPEPPLEIQPQYDFNQPYDNMDGHTFEHYCADLLSKNGFDEVEVTKGSGDQGIDIVAYKDGVKYGIQCKCYSSDIGNHAVQEAFAGKSFYNCHVAAVLTNRHFTKGAKDLAATNNVLLWDREKLEEFIKSADITVQAII